MKKILCVAKGNHPAYLEDFLNFGNSEGYRVDGVDNLADALLADLSEYDAIVFEMVIPRGSINDTREVGLYPIKLEDDLTYDQIHPDIDSSNPFYGRYMSDNENGVVFAWLARRAKNMGGLEYRGGLVGWSGYRQSMVSEIFKIVGFDIQRWPDVDKLSLTDILYLEKTKTDSISDMRKTMEMAAAYRFQGFFSRYIGDTLFSLN